MKLRTGGGMGWRVLTSYALWTAVLVQLILLIPKDFELYSLEADQNNVLMLYIRTMLQGTLKYFMPLACAWTGGLLFLDMWNTRYLYQDCIRGGKNRSLIRIVLLAALLGGLTAALPKLIFPAVSAFYYPFDNAAEPFHFTQGYADLASSSFPPSYFLGMAYSAFWAGAFWAITALAASVFIPNRFVVVAFPTLLVSCESFMINRLSWPFEYGIAYLTDGFFMPWTQAIWVTPLAMGGLCVLLSILFIIGAKRRLQNG